MKEIEMNINSPVFAEFITNLNMAVIKCLSEITADTFSDGEISAKIIIEAENACEVYATGTSKDGAPENDLYHYKKPAIEHKVTLTLKKREEAKGSYTSKMELRRDGNGGFILVEPKMAQMSLEEMEAAEDEE